jgi:hypothetical protein
MNFKIIIALIALTSMLSCKSTKVLSEADSETYFEVEVIQNGESISIQDQMVSLEKAPFKFQITFYQVDHVYVAPSWGKFYYDYPDSNNIFECDGANYDECRFFAGKTGAQASFNTGKELLVGDGSYQQVWFYDPEMDWHRFDKGVKVLDDKTIATMTVEHIYDCDGRDQQLPKNEYNYPIDQVNKEIYMVFATSDYNKETKLTAELQREKFTIRFK